MSRLTDTQLSVIQSYIDLALEGLDRKGLTLDVEPDTADWVRFMQAAPKISRINPTYDPRFSHARPENSFWIRAASRMGEIVACQCSRVFHTADFKDLIRTNLLFYDKKPILKHHPMVFSYPGDGPVIGGLVGHDGGLWIHPDYRGLGLHEILPRTIRGLCLRHFDIDWSTAVVKDRRVWARASYGFAHRCLCTRGYWPAYGQNLDIQLLYMDRHEILGQMRGAVIADTVAAVDADRKSVPRAAHRSADGSRSSRRLRAAG